MTIQFVSKELQARIDAVFENNGEIPSCGTAKHREGELVRAAAKVLYRFYNDGDYFYEGYGCETAGPSMSYIINNASPSNRSVFELIGHLVKDLRYTHWMPKADYADLIIAIMEGLVTNYENHLNAGTLTVLPEDEDNLDTESYWEECDEEDEDDYEDDPYDHS